MKTKRFFWVLIALLIVGSLVLGACGGSTEEPVVVADEPAADEPIAGTYYERAMAGEFSGTVVTMTGPFTDEDAVKFDSSVAAFEEATGIDIQYEGSKEFEATITLRVEAGDAPDIVDFPQPGLLSTFVARGGLLMSPPSCPNPPLIITIRAGGTWEPWPALTAILLPVFGTASTLRARSGTPRKNSKLLVMPSPKPGMT